MGNPDAPEGDLAYLVEYTRATAVITNPRTAELIYSALAAASLKALILVPEVATGGNVEGEPWSAPDPVSVGAVAMKNSWSITPPISIAPESAFDEGVLTPPTIRVAAMPEASPPFAPSPPAPASEPPPASATGAQASVPPARESAPPRSFRGIPPSSPLLAPYRGVATLSPVWLGEALEHGRDSVPYQAPPRRTKRDDVAIWLFTSGSTGKSKAAIHTHRDFAYNTECYAKRTVGYRRDDITVSVSRLFFGYATGTNLMFPFAVGGTTGLFSERPTPEALVAAIDRYRATVVTNVPTMMSKLLEYDDAHAAAGKGRIDLSSVRFHLSAGEALPPALLARFTERFKGDVYDGIGSAEMFHIYCSNRPGDIKPGSLGRVVEGYTLKILRAEAEGPGEPALPAGETGVMWVKGDSVALGYYQDRDKSWATFFGHWCRTGDLFRLDEEGYLWFTGRADDLLKVGGLWVSPLEVEDCLLGHPKVALAAVIGAEDDGLTKPKAFIVVRDEAREAIATEAGRIALALELKAHVQGKLSKHKYPRWVVFVDDVPKNDRGKVDRRALKAQEAEGGGPPAY
jgi:acyl-coenzyme A synthetase/AMP-(fatty) acid ligase